MRSSCAARKRSARPYLPKMVSGEWTGTMNLTEPQAGSDLSAVRTRAVPTGDGRYLVSGQKIFITYGEHDLTGNIMHMVLARVAGAPDGVKGTSLFLVPKFLVNADGSLGARNDVHCLSVEHKLGIHASPTCVLAFGQNGGAVAELIGEENRGLEYMFIMMNAARYSVGIEGVGLSERAYQTALAYARERIQGTEAGIRGGPRVPIVRHPDVRRMLMLMKSQTEAMRALAAVVAVSLDAARLHPQRGGARAPSGPRRSHDSRHQGLVHREFGRYRLAGYPGAWRRGLRRGDRGRAISARCPHHADLRGHHRHSGQRPDRPQARARRRSSCANAHGGDAVAGERVEREPALSGLAPAFSAAIDALERGDPLCGGKLCQGYPRRVRGRGADAQTVRASWPAAGSCCVRRRSRSSGACRARSGGERRRFYEAKILTARFYADYVLSQSPGLAHSIVYGAAGALAEGVL